jgi:plasmid stability protein
VSIRQEFSQPMGWKPLNGIARPAITAYIFVLAMEGLMASLTIRDLDEGISKQLRIRAAEKGHSVEEEVRDILRQVMKEPAPPINLAAAIRARIAPLGGVDLDLPEREPMPELPDIFRGRR